MNDTPSSDSPSEETRPLGGQPGSQQTLDPETPTPSGEAAGVAPAAPHPGYAPPYAGPADTQAGYPAYPGYPGYPGYPPAPRPRFRDQVLGMRAVIAVALVALVIGGLGGALLGALAHHGGDDRFGGPGGFQRGFNQGQMPHRQFQQNQP
ncbi:MAG: hypothetical protein WAV00_19315 [Nocardioides sp.]